MMGLAESEVPLDKVTPGTVETVSARLLSVFRRTLLHPKWFVA